MCTILPVVIAFMMCLVGVQARQLHFMSIFKSWWIEELIGRFRLLAEPGILPFEFWQNWRVQSCEHVPLDYRVVMDDSWKLFRCCILVVLCYLDVDCCINHAHAYTGLCCVRCLLFFYKYKLIKLMLNYASVWCHSLDISCLFTYSCVDVSSLWIQIAVRSLLSWSHHLIFLSNISLYCIRYLLIQLLVQLSCQRDGGL